MQTKNLKRSVRRHHREQAIRHAFDITWDIWYRDDAYAYNKRYDEKILLEENESRFFYQDNLRKKHLSYAKKIADNLCKCSCYMCSDYDYKKSPQYIRYMEKLQDDISSYYEE